MVVRLGMGRGGVGARASVLVCVCMPRGEDGPALGVWLGPMPCPDAPNWQKNS